MSMAADRVALPQVELRSNATRHPESASGRPDLRAEISVLTERDSRRSNPPGKG
jgi:hypothetical protein